MPKKIGAAIVALLCITASLFCVVMHVWTIIIAYSASGWLIAAAVMFFPVLSELYWFFRQGISFGFGVPYCVSLISCLILFCVASVAAIMYTESRK